MYMEFDSVVKKRASVRSFTSKKPSWKSILEAIEAAIQGPLAGNHNFLKFLIVEDKENIKFIAKQCEQEWISQASIAVIVLSDDTHLEEIYGDRGRVYSRQEAGAAIQTMLLKLVDLNLSSCWVGSYDDPAIKEKFKIPEQVQIEAILPIGYAASKSQKTAKKSMESVLYWEKWDQQKRSSLFEEDRVDYAPQGEFLNEK